MGFAIADVFIAVVFPEALGPTMDAEGSTATVIAPAWWYKAIIAGEVTWLAWWGKGPPPVGAVPANPDGTMPTSAGSAGSTSGTASPVAAPNQGAGAGNSAGNQGPGTPTSTGGGQSSPSSGGTGTGAGGGGNSGPVLYPVNSGRPYLSTAGGFWGKDWRVGHMGPGGTCCSSYQTPAESKTVVTLKEQFNGTGPWVQGGNRRLAVFTI